MTRLRTLAVATCACAMPAAALAAKPAPTTVSIAVSPSTITFGKPATVSGMTAPNTSLTLRADPFPYDGSFAQTARTTSNASGAYSFTVTPDRGTHYRVDAKAHSQSAVAALAVRWKVTRTVSTRHPARGARVRFSGTVGPANTGGTIKLQRLTATGFKTVKTAILVAATPTSSSYSLRVRVRRNGTYRAHVAADGAHLAGNSGRISLVVH